MEKTLKSLIPKVNAVGQVNSVSFPPQLNKNLPTNKRIVPQRMFQAKKKRKLNNRSEQNLNESTQNIALSLIMIHKNNMHNDETHCNE